VDDHVLLELSLGAVVRTVEELKHSEGTDTYVEALVPLLLGGRFHPIPAHRGHSFLPYLSVGGGPYWAADILSTSTSVKDRVTVDSRHQFGAYVGGGIDLMFTNWVGLNMDVKRHYVDFNTGNEHSGYEYALGLQFMWGTRKRHRGVSSASHRGHL
jgi:outer membrane protein W